MQKSFREPVRVGSVISRCKEMTPFLVRQMVKPGPLKCQKVTNAVIAVVEMNVIALERE